MMANKEESQLTLESLLEVKIHNETSERLNDVTFEWFSNQDSGFLIHEATKGTVGLWVMIFQNLLCSKQRMTVTNTQVQ